MRGGTSEEVLAVVELVDALPRQDNGKIYKRLLRDRYRTQQPAS